MKLLSDYYRVPRNPITERMELRKRVQQPGESVSNYVVDLKRMSRYCEYGTDLESNLRDTFSAGVRDPNVKQKLLLKRIWHGKTRTILLFHMSLQKGKLIKWPRNPCRMSTGFRARCRGGDLVAVDPGMVVVARRHTLRKRLFNSNNVDAV